MQSIQSRRRFLATLSCAGAAGFTGVSGSFGQEAPPETTSIRLIKNAGICIAPQYVADELLRAEGFNDVQYVLRTVSDMTDALGRGEVDLTLHFVANLILAMEAGQPITMLAGVHVGCFELFANDAIQGIRDLKGKRVGVQGLGLQGHTFLTSMAAYVGLDPVRDIKWVVSSSPGPLELFAEGKIDAFLGFPPEPQELRARNVGRVVVNSSTDRPWSQYFCCMLAGNRDFVRNNPVATKCAIRAILKAADFCASDPSVAARRMVDSGFTPRYDYAFQSLREVPYNKWHEYEPEDTIRFYALRLREAGMIKAPPNKIIADSADWRFLNQLKRELKS